MEIIIDLPVEGIFEPPKDLDGALSMIRERRPGIISLAERAFLRGD